MDRRVFLKNMSIATSAMCIPNVFAAGGASKAQPTPEFVKNPLRLAFIGTGGMGGANMRIFLNRFKQRCVAVCDVDTKYGAINQRKYTLHKQKRGR